MPAPAAFLIVDSDEASRASLAKLVGAAFPQSVIQETGDLDFRAVPAGSQSFDVVIYRVQKSEGLALVRRLRNANPLIGIVVISDRDQSKAATLAGANEFLLAAASAQLEEKLKRLIASVHSSNSPRQ